MALGALVSVSEYSKLRAGTVLDFVTLRWDGNKQATMVERGRLLYAFTHRREIYTTDWGGNLTITGHEMVPHRCGYVPLVDRYREQGDEKLLIYEVHIGVGAFAIRRVKAV
jgi:hypothetical protein